MNKTVATANLLLAGVGKAGTTSLYWYLSQHADICASSVKETRYFLPLSEVEERSEQLAPVATYETYFRGCGDERYRMEATPHYFHGGLRLTQGVAAVCPDARVVITLRDPIERLWSIYRFAQSMLKLDRLTIDAFVEEAERVLSEGSAQTDANRPFWSSIAGGMYARFLPAWRDVFGSNLRVVFFEDIRRDAQGVTANLCDWLGLNGDLTGVDFSAQNRTVSVRSRGLQRLALVANSEHLLRNHRVLKRPLRAIYYRVNGARATERLPDDQREHLTMLFRDSNKHVAEMLLDMGYRDLPNWLAGGAVLNQEDRGRV